MKLDQVEIEFDPVTSLYVGSVIGVRGAHSQAESIEALMVNLEEVLALLSDDNLPSY